MSTHPKKAKRRSRKLQTVNGATWISKLPKKATRESKKKQTTAGECEECFCSLTCVGTCILKVSGARTATLICLAMCSSGACASRTKHFPRPAARKRCLINARSSVRAQGFGDKRPVIFFHKKSYPLVKLSVVIAHPYPPLTEKK